MTRPGSSLPTAVSGLLSRGRYSDRADLGGGPGGGGHEIVMPESLCDQEGFRAAMRVFASSVSIITALDGDGVPRGLTCSAVCSLSMDPPSMLVCVNRQNRSLEAIRHSGGFVINLLKEGRSGLADIFASSSPTKFTAAEWRLSPESGLPLLTDDAMATIDCRLHAEIVVSSHAVLIGTVRQSETYPGADSPLLYLSRNYGRCTSPEVTELHNGENFVATRGG
jgi:flavin reductase (DIM6/NTAB) family NADH-FMN oxidoreductase RutF